MSYQSESAEIVATKAWNQLEKRIAEVDTLEAGPVQLVQVAAFITIAAELRAMRLQIVEGLRGITSEVRGV